MQKLTNIWKHLSKVIFNCVVSCRYSNEPLKGYKYLSVSVVLIEWWTKNPAPESNIVTCVMQELQTENIPGLPPGGGLCSK